MRNASQVDDNRIIAALKVRDKASMAILYDAYAPSLYGCILNIVQNEMLAAEVLRKAFIRFWEHCEEFDCFKQSLFIQLYSITHKVLKEEQVASLFLSEKEVAV